LSYKALFCCSPSCQSMSMIKLYILKPIDKNVDLVQLIDYYMSYFMYL